MSRVYAVQPLEIQMKHEHEQQTDQSTEPPFWRSRYGLGLIVLGAIAAYFLLSEHRAHFFGALPFLLLLACPLMHLFMHGGHGGGHGHTAHRAPAKQPPEQGDQP